MKFNNRATGWLSALLIAAVSPTAHAMLSANNGTPLPLVPNALGGALDGVGRLTLVSQPSSTSSGGSFQGYCSANLLSGGQYVLTAAHCVSGHDVSQVMFLNGAVTRAVSQVAVNPGYLTGHPLLQARHLGADVALLRLDQPVTTIPGYELAGTDVTGSTVLMAGYGMVGNGTTGSTDPNPQGLGHYGYNQFDVAISMRAGASLNGVLYGFDFDNGSLNQDTLCFLSNACGLGLGSAESTVALGDSGGGSFVWDGTKWVLAGVHSNADEWMRQPCSFDPGQTCGDANNIAYDSTFGEIFWDAAVQPHLAWIDSIVNLAVGQPPLPVPVPEPGTGLLIAMGGMGLWATAGLRPSRRAVRLATGSNPS